MIRRLRARHRGAFGFLALALPAGLVAALAGRRAAPPPVAWPGETPAGPWTAAADATTVMWSKHSLLSTTRRDAAGALRVRVHGWSEPAAPALCLYWSPSAPEGEALPEGARLLGALGSAAAAPLELTLAEVPAGGWLLVYSLGHGELAGSLALAGGG